MAKPVVFVIGAGGNVGTATLASLSTKYADILDIRAGVRNPDKAEALKGFKGVTLVEADMGGDKVKLTEALKGVDSLFIVTPPTKDRAELVIGTAEAAKEAGVKFLLVVSVLTADLTDTIFGAQFNKIENTVSQLGVDYSFLRLPLFVDNYWGFKDGIKDQSSIYSPVDPEKPYTPVVVADAGAAAAVILSDPSKHVNKTYKIVSERHTLKDVAAAFSQAIDKEVRNVHVSYEATKQILQQIGFQEWQADGVLELDKLINDGSDVTNVQDLSDYTRITGENPTDVKTWVSRVAGAFK